MAEHSPRRRPASLSGLLASPGGPPPAPCPEPLQTLKLDLDKILADLSTQVHVLLTQAAGSGLKDSCSPFQSSLLSELEFTGPLPVVGEETYHGEDTCALSVISEPVISEPPQVPASTASPSCFMISPEVLPHEGYGHSQDMWSGNAGQFLAMHKRNRHGGDLHVDTSRGHIISLGEDEFVPPPSIDFSRNNSPFQHPDDEPLSPTSSHAPSSVFGRCETPPSPGRQRASWAKRAGRAGRKELHALAQMKAALTSEELGDDRVQYESTGSEAVPKSVGDVLQRGASFLFQRQGSTNNTKTLARSKTMKSISHAITKTFEQMSEDSQGSLRHQHQVLEELRPIWKENKAKSGRPSFCEGRPSLRRSMTEHTVTSCQSQAETIFDSRASLKSGDTLYDENGCMQDYILKPGSAICIVWDVVVSLAGLWDLVAIPLQVFDLPKSFSFALRSVNVVWAMDIVFSFFRGFTPDTGVVVEMRPWIIACRYLKGFFWFDLFCICIDVLLLISEASGSAGGITFMRALRLLRLVRVLKLWRRMEAFMKFEVEAYSERWVAVFGITKFFSILMIINHLVACGWYTIGSLDSRGVSQSKHWVAEHLGDDSGTGYAYATSFHWSLCQFTPASMEVMPLNTAERIFTIVVVACGLVMFSSFVSNMTQAITHLRKLKYEENLSSVLVAKYISDNRVSVELANSVFKFVRNNNKHMHRTRIHEHDVKVLEKLPRHIRNALKAEVIMPTLCMHNFFFQLRGLKDHFVFVNSICTNATSSRSVDHGRELFHFGMNCTSVYFVYNGQINYYLGYDQDVFETCGDTVISEVAFWMDWEHRGRVTGEMGADVMQVDVAEFLKIASQSESRQTLVSYSKRYMMKLLDIYGSPEFLTDLGLEDEDIVRAVQKSLAPWAEAVRQNASVLMMLANPCGMATLFFAWRQAVRESRVSNYRRSRGGFAMTQSAIMPTAMSRLEAALKCKWCALPCLSTFTCRSRTVARRR